MTQLGPEFSTPRSHNNDPESSHRAEQRLRESGVMDSQIATVERLLRSFSGSTAKQLARVAIIRREPALAGSFDKCHSQIMRRLSDLKELKRARRQSTPGHDQVRWFHAED